MTNPTSEAVEAALERLARLHPNPLSPQACADWATLRAALTAAEEGRRKAEAGMEWLARHPSWTRVNDDEATAVRLTAASDAVEEGYDD